MLKFLIVLWFAGFLHGETRTITIAACNQKLVASETWLLATEQKVNEYFSRSTLGAVTIVWKNDCAESASPADFVLMDMRMMYSRGCETYKPHKRLLASITQRNKLLVHYDFAERLARNGKKKQQFGVHDVLAEGIELVLRTWVQCTVGTATLHPEDFAFARLGILPFSIARR